MNTFPRMDRRTALKWMVAASATLTLARDLWAESNPKGYGIDPDLLKHYESGDLWPLTLTDAQRRAATALCDVIIPADSESPSASAVGVVEFIDEWISAPYPDQLRDREIVLRGLDWINAESVRRFGNEFAALGDGEKIAICDDIAFIPKAKPEFADAAKFFASYRNLTAGGFYTTQTGRTDLRYIGNIPLAEFTGPTPEALRHVGLL